MKSLWSDTEAKNYVARYGDKGIAPDLALRVYTTRLLGGDPALVLHGGGNTSVKTKAKDLLGDEVDVICVKGSGWDMGDIEPPGLPAVKLAPLRRLLALRQTVRRGHGQLSADQSARFVGAQSVGRDAAARVPAAQIRRSHAFDRGARAHRSARRRGDGARHVRLAHGLCAVHDPRLRSGEERGRRSTPPIRTSKVSILLRHGIFTFAEGAREAYELMIEMVTLAEERLKRGKKTLVQANLPARLASVADIAPVLRGASALVNDTSDGTAKRQILCFRTNEEILNYVNGAELARYSQQGVATPDHTIRTKNWPLVVPAPEADKLGEWEKAARAAVEALRREVPRLFRAQQQARERRQEGARSVSARDPGAGCRPVRPGRIGQGRGDRRRHRREHGRGHHRCRAHELVPADLGRRSVRRRILVARAGEARQGGREAVGAAGGRRHRRRLGHRRGDGKSDGARRRGGCRARPRPRSGTRGGQSRSAAMRSGWPAT